MKRYFFVLPLMLLLACATFQPTPSPTPMGVETPIPTPTLPPTSAPLEPSDGLPIVLDEPFQLRVGERAILGNGELTVELQTILRDWRCPSQVECAEAGAVDLAIYLWLPGVEPTRFELSTNPPMENFSAVFDIYEVHLLAVDPYPESPDVPIPQEDYVVTFIVSLE